MHNLRRISLDVEVSEAKETRIIKIQQEGGGCLEAVKVSAGASVRARVSARISERVTASCYM